MPLYDANFDGQKLMYHPAETALWLATGRTRGPLYTEMTLTSACNCRCIFCGVDYALEGPASTIETAAAKRILDELAALGNKSVMFCGNGEPLLHPDAAEIIGHGSRLMHSSVTTNGIALDRAGVELIDGLEWIRFSINGGTDANYAQVHAVAPGVFERVVSNVEAAVARKRRRGLGVTVGTQLVLIRENAETALALARRMKEIGVDYFSVKPYSQHPLSGKRLRVDYGAFAGLEREIRALADERFQVIYRTGSMAKVGAGKPYGKCYGTHFICFISADGDVWECNVFAGDRRFRIGNATRESMADIWTGPRREEVLRFIEQDMDMTECRDVCRMDECNRYLWRLRHPWPHDDFI